MDRAELIRMLTAISKHINDRHNMTNLPPTAMGVCEEAIKQLSALPRLATEDIERLLRPMEQRIKIIIETGGMKNGITENYLLEDIKKIRQALGRVAAPDSRANICDICGGRMIQVCYKCKGGKPDTEKCPDVIQCGCNGQDLSCEGCGGSGILGHYPKKAKPAEGISRERLIEIAKNELEKYGLVIVAVNGGDESNPDFLIDAILSEIREANE